MYAEHVPLINNHMRESLDGFKRGVLFAVLSIRQPVTAVPEQLDAVARGDYAPLFGWKIRAFDYLESNGAALWQDVCAATDPAKAIECLCAVPGLGIVKAGFVLQFLGFDVACLDTRNVQREKRDPRAFRTDGKPPHKLRKKIAKYVGEVQGKAEHYWDAWCVDVAKVYKVTPDEISALHMAVTVAAQFDLDETF